MKVAILCGGQGSRIRDVSELVPKPMLAIGGRPMLWHIMKIYASYGITEFILALGYKGSMIREFFLNFRQMTTDCTVTLGNSDSIEYHSDIEEAHWRVKFVDTGERTMTGGRVFRLRKYLEDDEMFCLTYGDGLADIDVTGLINQHRASGLVGTISAVRVAGRFGELDTKNGKVISFEEKPAVSSGRVNGGFMVFDAKRVWKYLNDSNCLVFEREPLMGMARDGQLGYYEHKGFWQCMDTPREFDLLNSLWDEGTAPWKL